MTVSGRPLANLTLAVNYALSGTHTWSYHAFNLLVHMLAALTLFGVCDGRWIAPTTRDCCPAKEKPRKAAPPPVLKQGPAPPDVSAAGPRPGDSTFLALAITLLWALHPLQTEAVTYVVQRLNR